MDKPKEIYLGFKINLKKLWDLNIQDEEVPLESLSSNFDIPYLEKEGTDGWNLSVNELLSNLERERSHKEKMDNVDLKYPIDIYKHNGQWIILDGVHRLAKHKLLGNNVVMVRKITKDYLDKIKLA